MVSVLWDFLAVIHSFGYLADFICHTKIAKAFKDNDSKPLIHLIYVNGIDSKDDLHRLCCG